MDVALLTAFLAPFLPALLHAGQAVLDHAAVRGSAQAADFARGLWQRLHGRVAEQPAAEEAARKLGERPGSARRQRALAASLEALLADDDDPAREVAALWEQANAAGVVVVAAGDRAIAVGCDVAGSAIVSGDNAAIEQ